MDKSSFSPYIRTAMHSTIDASHIINDRVIFDYELIYVLSGICVITVENVPHTCKAGDVVFLRPGVTHRFEISADSDFVQPHIHFDMVYSKESRQRFTSFKNRDKMTRHELSLIHEDVFAQIDIPTVFIPQNPEEFKRLFFEIIDIYSARKYNYEIHYKAKLLELISCILEQFEDTSIACVSEEYNHIISVKNYIDHNFLSVITLDSLARQFYINKFTLMRKFKANYNDNIFDYYRYKRIDYAKQVLKTSAVSIGEIAELLSFSDIYSFSRFFKKYTGMSPSEYRKKCST